jgi:hypothetical protein
MPLPLPPGELPFKSPREYSGLLPRLKKKRVRNRFPRPPDTGTEPNSYEAPRCPETDSPWERMFGSFSARELLAPFSSGHVC